MATGPSAGPKLSYAVIIFPLWFPSVFSCFPPYASIRNYTFFGGFPRGMVISIVVVLYQVSGMCFLLTLLSIRQRPCPSPPSPVHPHKNASVDTQGSSSEEEEEEGGGENTFPERSRGNNGCRRSSGSGGSDNGNESEDEDENEEMHFMSDAESVASDELEKLRVEAGDMADLGEGEEELKQETEGEEEEQDGDGFQEVSRVFRCCDRVNKYCFVVFGICRVYFVVLWICSFFAGFRLSVCCRR